MDKHYTLMLISEREKGVKSIRIPSPFIKAGLFLLFLSFVLIGILSYDYIKLVNEAFKNKHLQIENRELREQVQLIDRKINTILDDIERIYVFEKKLRIITGTDKADLTRNLEENKKDSQEPIGGTERNDTDINKKKKYDILESFRRIENFKDSENYNSLKNLYEQKIATNLGVYSIQSFTKDWSNLYRQSFEMADRFAEFDYKLGEINSFINQLEISINHLDTQLLDKDSYLKSLPSLLPTKGWITSYYGPRKSHYSGRIKMHEGIDIGARVGRKVVSPADGVVTFSGKKPGFGYFVQIDHGYGIETIFAHNSKLDVTKGDQIKRGQTIARVGSTGYSTGPHLHYEVRVNGTPVDPLYFILD
ncbi:MAG: M23 family metallopeptidase [Bdellovibrionales bacterium]|nr:M23 family metallopeptidase [Bdellovibrionales bacterium]